jgi:site-specific DNA-methyltransferase (adenine-specific)
VKPYFQDDAVTIYHGDCREVLPTLGPVDLVLTDPPYPGYNKGWEVPDVAAILAGITAHTQIVFWPAMLPAPLDVHAEHIWHKPNGCSAHHYERILVGGVTPLGCKVYREAAILPNYVQYAAEAVAHPTQKPVKLIKRLLERFPDAHAILDPFMGSGTTLRAAKDLGRKAIGIEIEERYCEIAAKRMSQSVMALA